MSYKKRLLENKLRHVGDHFPVIVLTGARQVGKSTLLKHLLPEARISHSIQLSMLETRGKTLSYFSII